MDPLSVHTVHADANHQEEKERMAPRIGLTDSVESKPLAQCKEEDEKKNKVRAG
jgi:hypothetical protein